MYYKSFPLNRSNDNGQGVNKKVNEGAQESKEKYRNATNHVELGIPSYHTSNSRRGYGRSLDGSFYTP